MMKNIAFCCLLFVSGVAFGKGTTTTDTITLSLVVKDKASTYTIPVLLNQKAEADKFKSNVVPFVEISQYGQIGNVKVDSIQADPPYVKSFSLNLKSIPYTGRFMGKVILISTVTTAPDTIVVPIMLHVISDDDLVVSTAEPPSLNYVRNKFLSCMLPGEYKQETIRIGLQNKSLYAADLDSCILSLRGTKTHHVVSRDNYDVSKKSLSGQLPGEILVKIVGSMPADEYKGTLSVKKQPGLTVSEVPVTVNVRHGVLWPLVVMIGGMIFGFFARSVEGANDLIALLNRLRFIEEDVEHLHALTGKDQLRIRIEQARANVKRMVPGRDVSRITEQVALMEKQAINMQQMDLFMPQLESISDPGKKAEAEQLLAKLANTNLVNIEQYEAELEAFNRRLREILSGNRAGLRTRGEAEVDTLPEKPVQKARDETQTTFTNFIRVSVISGVFQPVVFIVTVLLAIMAGFYEAYVSKELTFGVGGIFDYIKLFIYGAGIVIVVREVFTSMLPTFKKQFGIS